MSAEGCYCQPGLECATCIDESFASAEASMTTVGQVIDIMSSDGMTRVKVTDVKPDGDAFVISVEPA